MKLHSPYIAENNDANPIFSGKFKLAIILCPSILAIHPMLAVSADGVTADTIILKGMDSYKKGHLKLSMDYFNEAEIIDPGVANRLWQKGLALYNIDKFEECSNQFQRDFNQNPADAEEKIWDILCKSRSIRDHTVDSKYIAANIAPATVFDSRWYMRLIYEVFSGKIDPQEAITRSNLSPQSAAYYYINLYLSFYFDVQGDIKQSKELIQNAMNSYYAKSSSDYMLAVGRYQYVHLFKDL
jgi:tetratricopeptide (TPR) repeat protein